MKILFLCVANSARSQMAEGLAKRIFGKTAEIISAGSSPSFVHPLAIKAMQEVGIDITDQSSKSITSIDLSNVDRIVTLCADEVCPYVAGNIVKDHWPLPDPARPSGSENAQFAQFRAVRDELKKRIQALKTELEG